LAQSIPVWPTFALDVYFLSINLLIFMWNLFGILLLGYSIYMIYNNFKKIIDIFYIKEEIDNIKEELDNIKSFIDG
jgi:hypothetical protein